MGTGSRVVAKGEEIDYDGEKYNLVPLNNKQLLEIQNIVSQAKKENENQKAMEALMEMAVESLNNGLKEGEKQWTVEEMEVSPTPFLMEVFDCVVRINKLEKMFDFQRKSQAYGHPTLNPLKPESEKSIYDRNLELLNQNPQKKLGNNASTS